jgi:hemerythrin-like metal-binding protein
MADRLITRRSNMQSIIWDPSFSVGVAKLDAQHKKIIDIINLLRSTPDVDVRSETVSELLTRLRNYASDHFATEEQLLVEHGYPELVTHKEAHKAYRRKVMALCEDTMDQNASVPEELLRFLGDWWVNHILGDDMRYRSFLMQRGLT